MRKLKIPGRFIGNKAAIAYHYLPDVSLPASVQYLSKQLLMIEEQRRYQYLKQRWLEVARQDSEESRKRYEELIHYKQPNDVDRDGRDRSGMPLKPTQLNEAEIRTRLLIEITKPSIVTILSDGSVKPTGRSYPYSARYSVNSYH